METLLFFLLFPFIVTGILVEFIANSNGRRCVLALFALIYAVTNILIPSLISFFFFGGDLPGTFLLVSLLRLFELGFTRGLVVFCRAWNWDNLRCAITGNVMKENDRVVVFPYFRLIGLDPTDVCSHNKALRSEFERWRWHKKALSRAQKGWAERFSMLTPLIYQTLALEPSFYVVKNKLRKKIYFIFLNHVFVLDIPKTTWPQFCREVAQSSSAQLQLDARTRIGWEPQEGGGVLLSLREPRRYDAITLTAEEWAALQQLVAAVGGRG